MRSMTGFGRSDGTVGDTHYTFESKSVNHRYLEARFRLPSALSSLEIPLNELLRSRFERGSFELSIRTRLAPKQGAIKGVSRFIVDELALRSLLQSLEKVSKAAGTPIALTAEAVISTARVVVATEEEKDEAIFTDIKGIVEKGLQALSKMRESEGQRLSEILLSGINDLQEIADRILKASVDQPQLIHERLTARLKKWKLEGIDSQRLELELALLADKADVSEELDRLAHHLGAFRAALKDQGSVGRKLDFLLQEINREVNTLGAKVASTRISQSVIEAKHAIEKLREQAQNVE
ncbi:MAG: YicC family protein [Deltaproteobacteria bacterium]|nr:YicC family protein [Deltaproteobacteria bacterium]